MYKLYSDFTAAGSQEEQKRLMDEILDIVEETFHVMGTMVPNPTITLAKENFRNVPESLILGWSYPSDSPVGVEQFFIDN